ncbi:MAG: polysaccharide biosynthesis C-terminal domain-containing protein [Ekhidna sp.]|nr:polysaccharide biosynthesis C-terminal domain-containing protein [Ekhidna sp.]
MYLLKKLVRQTAVYGLSSILGRLLNYLLVPLYTTVFASGEYGVLTELYAYAAFLNILYVYGLETTYFRFSKDGDNIFHVAFTSILVSSLVLSGILWMASDSIVMFLDYPERGDYIRWLALIVAIDAIVAVPFAKLREDDKVVKFAVFKLSNIGINILLNLFFIVFCPRVLAKNPEHFLSTIYEPELGIGYVFVSNLIANALYLIFFIPTWRTVKLKFDSVEWSRMMTYAWPVLIIGFAGVTNEMLSRAMLKHRLPEGFYPEYSNLEILGIFGACYKLSVFMTLAIQAFRYAFEPFFFTKARDKNSPRVFSKVMTYFVLFTSFFWLVLCLFMPYYAPIFLRQESYLIALDSVPWLLGGGMFLGIFYNLSLWYKLTDHTLYGAYISLIGAASTFFLNWILIPTYGYMGSAYATFFSYLLMVVISYSWGRKYYPVPYSVLKIIGYILLAGIGVLLNETIGASFLLSIFMILIFLTLAFLTERKSLMQIKF